MPSKKILLLEGGYNEEHDIDSTITFNISSNIPVQNYCNSTIPLDYNQEECIFEFNYNERIKIS